MFSRELLKNLEQWSERKGRKPKWNRRIIHNFAKIQEL